MSTQTIDAPITGGLFDNDLREHGGYNYGGYIPGHDYLPEHPKRPTRAYLGSAAALVGTVAAVLFVLL